MMQIQSLSPNSSQLEQVAQDHAYLDRSIINNTRLLVTSLGSCFACLGLT